MMIFSEVIAKKMPIFSKYSICQPPLAREAAAFIAFSFLGFIKSNPDKIIIYETKQTINHFDSLKNDVFLFFQ